MKVTATARELLDRLVWVQACDMLGLNEWAVNEGRMDASDTVTLTLEQARELGLLEPRSLAGYPPARPVITRAVQTCFGCPAQWDAWDADGSQYYLRYRHSYGSAERVRRGADEWLDGDRRETVGEFETDENDGGVIRLEEFCERAGLELRLA